MKLLSVFILAALSLQPRGCGKKSGKPPAGCYKGTLAVKGMCMNYTIAVTAGATDSTLVEAAWRDESTGKTYRNAFGLASRCSFPAGIREGDAFWFVIDSSGKQDCAVCLAYYPTPAKKLSIRVLPNPCTP
ncbi:MAG: hypothetical protein EOO11_02800 [Chitinophagaceae bacterium]|nr:MAG: hypothetical protein EOO11_02800 [Chitinophagaceae bacterium]